MQLDIVEHKLMYFNPTYFTIFTFQRALTSPGVLVICEKIGVGDVLNSYLGERQLILVSF